MKREEVKENSLQHGKIFSNYLAFFRFTKNPNLIELQSLRC
jgi:hypothetical protein